MMRITVLLRRARAGSSRIASRSPNVNCRAAKPTRSNLPPFRVYDLRHTFATLLLNRGVPITYVSAQLAHADPTTTLTWYAYYPPESDGTLRRPPRQRRGERALATVGTIGTTFG
jgi:integrase